MEFFIERYYIADTFLLFDNGDNEIILNKHCFEIYNNKNIYSFRYSIVDSKLSSIFINVSDAFIVERWYSKNCLYI